MLPDPIQDMSEAELVTVKRAVDELASDLGFDIEVETVAAEKDVSGGEGDR